MEIPKTIQLLQEGIESGLHIGVQLFVMIDGHAVVDLALGNARLAADTHDGHDIAMMPDTLMLWLSAGKPITAAGILLLRQRGIIALDDAVAKYLPEFAREGKDSITLRHLLTHTAGLRSVDASYPFENWQEVLDRIYVMKMERDWVPGLRAGYHTHTSWYVLGELISRLTGMPCAQWLRENILLPIGMKDTWLAMSPDEYRAYGNRIGFLYDTAVKPPVPLKNYDTELAASRARPSASCRGPVRELAKFYEMLRRGGEVNETRLLKQETVAAMTMRQRVGMYDQTFRQTIDWGLGIIVNSAHYGPGIPYQFGPYASRETFGHGGSQSSTGFCDPMKKLVVGLVFNGCPGEAAHDKRLRALLKALYEDLDLDK
ncbi:MAG TPA: serine hydrolase domain-containing protein [Phycisphaerae bacterium]